MSLNPTPVIDPPAEPHMLLSACERITRRTGGLEELRVSIETYRGSPYVSMRIFYQDRDGVMRPTRRGLSVRVHELEAVIAALEDAHFILATDPAPEGKPVPCSSGAGAAFAPRIHRPDDSEFYQGEASDE